MGLNFTISTAQLDVTGGGRVVEPEHETGWSQFASLGKYLKNKNYSPVPDFSTA